MLFGGHWALYARRTLIVTIVVLAVTAVSILTSWNTTDFAMTCAVWAAIWLLLAHLYVLRPWLHYRGWVREPNVTGECEVKVEADALHAGNARVESRYEWSMFTRRIERGGLFVLRIGKKQMIVIPKSAFASDEDLARFREIVTSKIGG